MTDKIKTPPSSRRSRRGRRGILIFLVVALPFALFYFYVTSRGGRDYHVAPELLLPPDTALLVTWRNLSRFLEDFENLEATRAIREDEELSALLLADPEWLSLQKRVNPAHYQILRSLLRNFVETWLGREVSLALAPPSAETRKAGEAVGSIRRTGLILIARTDIGFEENLAELAIQLIPQARLSRRDYREHILTVYEAPKEHDGFAYCRFGKTVVLSLRSADPRWLMDLVDRKIALESGEKHQAGPSLAEAPAFVAARDWTGGAKGLRAHINPASLPRALRRLPFKGSDDPKYNFWVEYLEEEWGLFEWAALKLDLENGLTLDGHWRVRPEERRAWRAVAAHPLSPAFPRFEELLSSFPAETSVAAQTRHPDIRANLGRLHGRLKNSILFRKDIEDFEKDWLEMTGLDPRTDFLNPLDEGLGLALTGLAGGAFFPIPQGLVWWNCDSDAKAESVVLKINGRRLDPEKALVALFARMRAFARARRVWVQVNAPIPKEADETAAPESRIPGLPPDSGNTHLAPIYLEHLPEFQASQVTLCAVVDFRKAHAQLRQIHAAAALWSKDVRKNVHRWEAAMAILQRLKSARLLLVNEPEGARLLLRIDAE